VKKKQQSYTVKKAEYGVWTVGNCRILVKTIRSIDVISPYHILEQISIVDKEANIIKVLSITDILFKIYNKIFL